MNIFRTEEQVDNVITFIRSNLRMNSSPQRRGVYLSNSGPYGLEALPFFIFLKRYFKIISSTVAGRALLPAHFCLQITFLVLNFVFMTNNRLGVVELYVV